MATVIRVRTRPKPSVAICCQEFPLVNPASSHCGRLLAAYFQCRRTRTHPSCERHLFIVMDVFSAYVKFFKYIAIHARRANDFTVYCNDVPKQDCFPSIATYSRRIGEIQEETRSRLGIIPQHVVMLSDEEDPAWWDSIREVGWYAPDHVAEDTVNRYGRW